MQLRGHVLCPNEHVCINADKLGVKGYEEPTSRERRATRRQIRRHNNKLGGTGQVSGDELRILIKKGDETGCDCSGTQELA